MTLIKFFGLLLAFSLLISCSPHPGAGKWQAIGDNSLAIKKLSVLYEGKSEFTSIENESILWHCFWGAETNTKMSMSCTPSTDTETHEPYEFNIIAKDTGQLSRNGKVIGDFSRVPYQ